LGQFESLSSELTELVTGESPWLTRAVGLANLATAEGKLAEPTWSISLTDWSVPAQKNVNLHASAFLEHKNYTHRSHK
jgi:hypothetical protein